MKTVSVWIVKDDQDDVYVDLTKEDSEKHGRYSRNRRYSTPIEVKIDTSNIKLER